MVMASAVWEASVLAALLSSVALAILFRVRRALPQDIPNDRSLHGQPVPRAGGFAIWSGFVPAALLFPPPFHGGVAAWLAPWALLVGVSAWDDRRAVPVAARLAAHAVAALWFGWMLARGGAAASAGVPVWIAVAGIGVIVAWASNLYNFMDGSDGLAATMGVIGFAAMGIAARHDASAPALCALAAAIVPFLAVNRPRASMFLGDAGAVPLGFLAAAFALDGVAASRWPAWFPLLVFLPFVADATFTLVRRALAGETLWRAHRDHCYQRLNRLGAGHAGTLAVYGALALATAVTALACLFAAPGAGAWALAAWLAVVLMLFAAIDYHWRKNEKPAPTR
jgi:UDP-N-acetylmuramyl pentapeptide phosphotransferase/UDP-N-acetylglucosamine-1-phosphate transferase